MERVDLNLAHFNRQGAQTTYLSAKSENEYDKGEATSDYLGFFGFGSGTDTGKSCPEVLKGYINFDFSCLDDGASTVYAEFISVLQDLKRIGITPDFSDVRKFVREIYRSSTAPVSNLPDLIDTALHSVRTNAFKSNPSAPVYPVMITFSIRNGRRFLSFGIHEFDTAYQDIVKMFHAYPHEIWKEGKVPGFNWDFFTQLGARQHSISLLKAMKRQRFVTNWDETESVINKTIDGLDLFYTEI